MLKITFERPRIGIGISDEAKSLFGKAGKPKKKEKPKPWTHKERFLVGLFLILTILLSLYFYYKGQGRVPDGTWLRLPEFKFSFGGFGINETVILEK